MSGVGVAILVLFGAAGVASLILHRRSRQRGTPLRLRTLHLHLDVPEERAQRAARAVLDRTPWVREVHLEPDGHGLTARTVVNIWTFGEDLRIECEANGDRESLVTLRSSSRVKSALVDYGKSRRNLDRISDEIIREVRGAGRVIDASDAAAP